MKEIDLHIGYHWNYFCSLKRSRSKALFSKLRWFSNDKDCTKWDEDMHFPKKTELFWGRSCKSNTSSDFIFTAYKRNTLRFSSNIYAHFFPVNWKVTEESYKTRCNDRTGLSNITRVIVIIILSFLPSPDRTSFHLKIVKVPKYHWGFWFCDMQERLS